MYNSRTIRLRKHILGLNLHSLDIFSISLKLRDFFFDFPGNIVLESVMYGKFNCLTSRIVQFFRKNKPYNNVEYVILSCAFFCSELFWQQKVPKFPYKYLYAFDSHLPVTVFIAGGHVQPYDRNRMPFIISKKSIITIPYSALYSRSNTVAHTENRNYETLNL